MILFWTLLVLGIVALLRWLGSGPAGGSRDRTAIAVLKERYARGEIDREEFQQKMRDLEG